MRFRFCRATLLALGTVLAYAPFASAQRGSTLTPRIRGTLAALQDSSAYVRLFALDALQADSVREAIPQIVHLLRDPHRGVQSAAAEALADIGSLPSQYRAEILSLLDPDKPAQYAAAARVLGAAGWLDPREGSRLASMLEDPRIMEDDYVRIRIALLEALGGLGQAGAPYVENVRFMAIRSYQAISHDPVTRRDQWIAALNALGRFGRASVPALLELSNSAEADSLGSDYCSVLGQALVRTGIPTEQLAPDLLGRMKNMSAGCVLGVLESMPEFARQYEPSILAALGSRADSLRYWIPVVVTHRNDVDYLLNAMQGRAPLEVALAVPRILEEQPSLVVNHASQIRALLNHPSRFTIVAAAYVLASADELPAGEARRLAEMAFDPYTAEREQQLALATYYHLDSNRLRQELTGWEDSLFHLASGLRDLESFNCIKLNPTLRMYGPYGLPQNAPVAAGVLARMAPWETGRIVHFLELAYPEEDTRVTGACFGDEYAGMIRYFAYQMTGGDRDKVLVVRLTGGTAGTWREAIHADEARTLLTPLLMAWDSAKDLPRLQAELAPLFAEIVRGGRWEDRDVALIEGVERRLRVGGHLNEADAVRTMLSRNRRAWYAAFFKWSALGYVLLWTAILLAYPKSRWVRSNIVWHPWVRNILGVGLPGFVITSIRPLTAWILRPFSADLRSGAQSDEDLKNRYFPEVEVKSPRGEVLRLLDAFPKLRGRVVLEGRSGLGKTMFLRQLVLRTSGPIVYLPASSCNEGVIQGIGRYMPGALGDVPFLTRLVYSGGLDICIDGLNEVSLDVRQKVLQFLETARSANVIVATQPLEWLPPPGVGVYRLEALPESKIRDFLVHYAKQWEGTDLMRVDDFPATCDRYLQELRSTGEAQSLWSEMLDVLSNPMDLTIVAHLLAYGRWPSLFQLQREHFEAMEASYRLRNAGSAFPILRFSEAVYTSRTNDETRVPEGFPEEVLALLEHRMVVGRQIRGDRGESIWTYRFRHEKISDFFVAESFMAAGADRWRRHLGDPRFRGVYLLLATRLPPSDANELKEAIVDYAAASKDHTLFDDFIPRLDFWTRVERERALTNSNTTDMIAASRESINGRQDAYLVSLQD